ncbi:MAG TPA: hypothetical protein VF721_15555 [Pyrinomonadaceae bacterium]
MWLPIGLLCATGFSLIASLTHTEMPDSVDGFFKGAGITLLLMAIFTRKCAKTLCK